MPVICDRAYGWLLLGKLMWNIKKQQSNILHRISKQLTLPQPETSHVSNLILTTIKLFIVLGRLIEIAIFQIKLIVSFGNSNSAYVKLNS